MLIILSVFCSYMISNVFCVCKGDKKKKTKPGSGSSTSSNSRSSTPTIATDGAANTIAAATTKLKVSCFVPSSLKGTGSRCSWWIFSREARELHTGRKKLAPHAHGACVSLQSHCPFSPSLHTSLCLLERALACLHVYMYA